MAAKQDAEATSTRPYLIRALHEWCCDNGFTPYITVAVDASVQVPKEYVKDGEIVLNIGFDATTSLNIGNEYIDFKARFSGVVQEIFVPVDQIMAIFARENGQGMAFPKVASAERKPAADKTTAPRAVVSLAQPNSKRKSVDAAEDGPSTSTDATTDTATNPQKPAPGGNSKPTLTRVK